MGRAFLPATVLFLCGAVGEGRGQDADLLNRWPSFPRAYPLATFLEQAPWHEMVGAQPASLRLWGRELVFLYYCAARASGHQVTSLRCDETVHDAVWMENRSPKLEAQFRRTLVPILAAELAENGEASRHDRLARAAWGESGVAQSPTRAARRFALVRTEQELLRHLDTLFARHHPRAAATDAEDSAMHELLTVLRHTRAPREFLRWLHDQEGEARHPVARRERFLRELARADGRADATIEWLEETPEERWSDLALPVARALRGPEDSALVAAADHPAALPMSFPLVTGNRAYRLPPAEPRLRVTVRDGVPESLPPGMLIPLSEAVGIAPCGEAFSLERGGILGGFFCRPVGEIERGTLRIELAERSETDLAELLRISVYLSTIPIPPGTHGPGFEVDLTHAASGAMYREVVFSLAPDAPVDRLRIRGFEVTYVTK